MIAVLRIIEAMIMHDQKMETAETTPDLQIITESRTTAAEKFRIEMNGAHEIKEVILLPIMNSKTVLLKMSVPRDGIQTHVN